MSDLKSSGLQTVSSIFMLVVYQPWLSPSFFRSTEFLNVLRIHLIKTMVSLSIYMPAGGALLQRDAHSYAKVIKLLKTKII